MKNLHVKVTKLRAEKTTIINLALIKNRIKISHKVKSTLNVTAAFYLSAIDKLQWFHYESIGKVIARVPQKFTSPEEYYGKIKSQVFYCL